jgi:TRAP transporter 4TM/12TM fusion protein
MTESQKPDRAKALSPAPPPIRVLVITLAIILVLGSIAKATDFYRTVGLQLYDQQFMFPMIGAAFLLTFVHLTPRKTARDHHVPWYDWVLGLSGLFACCYLAWEYPRLADIVVYQPADAVACGIVVMVLCAEGIRRAAGMVLLIVLLGFIAFGVLGQHIPGQLQGQEIEFGDLVTYLSFDTNALMGVPMRVVTTIVIAFLLMAALMRPSGAAEFLNDVSIALMGRYRGGGAKVAICASSLFGSISGSVGANIMSTGAFTIPMMKEGGYRAESAGAIEAVASTGGQLMPPVMGAVAFVMADFLDVDYIEVCIAALIPSVLYYGGLFVQADLEAARDGIARIEQSLIPRLTPVLKRGWIFTIPFAVLVVSLFWLNHEPEEAALEGSAAFIVVGLLFGYKGRRLTLRDIFWAVAETGVLVIDLVMIGAAVGMIIGIIAKSGLGFALTLWLSQIGTGNLLLLLVMSAIVCIVLGMGMPTIGVYVLVATLVAPAMIETGISPMAAHMFVLYYGMLSFITPPVCIGAFFAAKLAESDQMRTGFVAMRFGWSAFVVPFLFIFSPSLLFEGEALILLLDVAMAIAGVWLVSAALIGYLYRPLSMIARAAIVVSGLALLIPIGTFPGAVWTDVAGGIAAGIIVYYEYSAMRRARPSAA